MEVYKIVRQGMHARLFSPIVYANSPHCLSYPIGQPVVSSFRRIFVFCSAETAVLQLRQLSETHDYHYQAWACYTPAVQPIKSIANPNNESAIEWLWHTGEWNTYHDPADYIPGFLANVPADTQVCQTLTMLRRLG